MARFKLLGMPIDRLQPGDFVDQFLARAKAGRGGYVCVPNVQQCVLAHDEQSHLDIMNGADWVIPDSTVLHRFLARRHRLPDLAVLRGDLLTLAICRQAAQEGVPIALIGGKNDEVLEKMSSALRENCPGLKIAYAYSPPFRELTDQENGEMLANIRASGARIVFVGLGGPKQERWMARHTDQLSDAMLIGVGAAFDWISGEVKTSATWVHGAGLEWLHRLISEPRRLWRRYLTTNTRFIWLYLAKEATARRRA